VGNLGFSEISFPKPVFHGDTMYAETLVAEKRESKSRPGEGIVTFAHTARNQHGEVVATATRKTLVRMLPAAGANESTGTAPQASEAMGD
jgi:acyl dehydratase